MKQRHHIPELESVSRITNIPIVETGWNYAGQLYNRIKKSNNLVFWTFNQAESSFYAVLSTASPAVFLFEGPLTTIDKIICKSLDVFEQRVPSINLPPQMIYFNTKQYVSDVGKQIARPVLKRADSVKQIGNSVLASKYTTFAAEKLDGALVVADMYVDKYLPADATDNSENDVMKPIGGPHGKAINASQHVYRFSKKLRRRLTQRTLAEAKALKEHSAEAIHVIVYVAEMIATDPKLALQKGIELWDSLSGDEPENQARPENLEQLIVMLSRETARRVVHLINFTSAGVSKLPKEMTRNLYKMTSACIQLLDNLIKTAHLEGVQQVILDIAKLRLHRVTILLKQLNASTTDLLEHLSTILASQGQDPIYGKCETPSPPPITTNALPSPNDNKPHKTSTAKQQQQQQQQQQNFTPTSRSSQQQQAGAAVPVTNKDSLRPPVAAVQEQQLKANRHHHHGGKSTTTMMSSNNGVDSGVTVAGQQNIVA